MKIAKVKKSKTNYLLRFNLDKFVRLFFLAPFRVFDLDDQMVEAATQVGQLV